MHAALLAALAVHRVHRLAGALIRHFFVARHAAKRLGTAAPWGVAAAGVLLLVVLAVALMPARGPAVGQAPATVGFAQVQAVINQRCVLCHNAQVQNKNVALHTEALVRQHAQAIYQQAVLLKQMPLNNATQITDEERALIQRWHDGGQP